MFERTCPNCGQNFETPFTYFAHECRTTPVYKLVYVNDATEEQGTLSTGTDYAALENYAALLRVVRPGHEHFEVVFEADDRNLDPLADLSDTDFHQAAP